MKFAAMRLIEQEMTAYRLARSRGEYDMAWCHLERAHILSQPYLRQHLANHRAMLAFAFRQRDWSEALGQIFRLILAPIGALTGKLPIGNTGRSTVSAFQPMPIPPDLLELLQDGMGE
ncbi:MULTISPECIES: DUF3703 domain-containing protein [Erythrobacter/Porphyrobacter group]|jgi:hypothetical protein|uniref:DUF3703 domain-containing protein n=1 Tax=Erythrobacter/Porphyrobacter group TaxID=2800788 RepID=UPI000A3BCA77|nr:MULTISPECIES: DUF3703 domain-containing protein [Erythrobacter/Porphyrobacter group]ASJ89926.1 hypothetical protein CBR61_02550 [Porphyrobacter sp. CACIAM 03H1]